MFGTYMYNLPYRDLSTKQTGFQTDLDELKRNVAEALRTSKELLDQANRTKNTGVKGNSIYYIFVLMCFLVCFFSDSFF